MNHAKRTMDGNEAAAYVSYAFTETAAIYPITPSSAMAEHVDTWAANGKKNIFGEPVKLVEMQSEAGAVGTLHGALEAGALATTYTSSQGLLLMVPTMYRIAGHMRPGVIHVAARSVATHAYSINAEHSDVMACRQTGFAMLASSSVQEVMDLGAVAHLSAIRGSLPFLHFFDGFKTSHELQKIECLDYDELAKLVDREALRRFRKSALNSEYPCQHSAGHAPEFYFQGKEAVNPYYDRLPEIVEEAMRAIEGITGRRYELFQYYGAPDAEHVLVAIGSVNGTIEETVDYLNARGAKVGAIQVHLYRPFSAKHFLQALPGTARTATVLDRTKESGAVGEPLYEDVCAVLREVGSDVCVLAGRYGLGGKDTTPSQINAVFENAAGARKSPFTVGITDDVTGLSLPVTEKLDTTPAGTYCCKFWGLGSDGTVSANKSSIKIIGDHTALFIQANFEYDGKKSGGLTRSHLRFGKSPIRSSYGVGHADFVACHTASYLHTYDMVRDVKEGGIFLLNCGWSERELDRKLPAAVKRTLARRRARFYCIDATAIAEEIGLGNRTNTILQAAFFKLAEILPAEEAAQYMKEAAQKAYGAKGAHIVEKNCLAVDLGMRSLRPVSIPSFWLQADLQPEAPDETLPELVQRIMLPIKHLQGETLPVSAFSDIADGRMMTGTSKYEKRGIAARVPHWDAQKCIQCNLCAFVCPHAAIRPILVKKEEKNKLAARFETVPASGKGMEGLQFRMQVDPLDCLGCGSCAKVCLAKEKALTLVPLAQEQEQILNWNDAVALGDRPVPMDVSSVKGSQFRRPLLEFSGACAGCGQTPYAKLATQLFGDRMYIANATGCSQVWSTDYPSVPYTVNSKGRGPAHSNSLFENNAEFGLGMLLGVDVQRRELQSAARELEALTQSQELKAALHAWFEAYDDSNLSQKTGDALRNLLARQQVGGKEGKLIAELLAGAEHLSKKSIWIIGGDGWAYDIGYGGLDHVVALGADVNILIFDNEVYSNTGGQASKATPRGAVAQFAAAGRRSRKKNLGLMEMQYKNAYIAQVAMGANPAQTLKAFREAESFHGPSILVAYSPCILHGMRCGMGDAQGEMKRAVAAGYWNLYRYDPRRIAEGKNPMMLDSPMPKEKYREFLLGESRYARLLQSFTETAETLFEQAEADAGDLYRMLRELGGETE